MNVNATTKQLQALTKISKATCNGELTLIQIEFNECIGVRYWREGDGGPTNSLLNSAGEQIWADR